MKKISPLGQAMREFRHNKKWMLQTELADMIGISRHRISDLENGRKNTKLETAVKIAKVIGFDLNVLKEYY